MDCREDLDFHDDSGRAVERAKESILLMKKKMFRSHDLILQYNNKLKEYDRLKGELCMAREEATKLKRENNSRNTKIVKLESQIAEFKKIHLELESKIADRDVQIASDKCHLEQLVCKLESLEDKNSGMVIEADMQKSLLEGKIKELEQELRKLKKSYLVDAQKQGEPVILQRGKRVLGKNQIIEKETVDVGVNTTEAYEPVKLKPETADKLILTNEFYHIKDNPYPIFCDKCESLIKPSIDKFCKIMTSHPPLLGEMLSPPPFREEPNVGVANILDDPVEPIASNVIISEIENLKRKIETLERKTKKRKKQISRESQQPSVNCCGHSRPTNCCSHGTSHPGTMPNVLPNVQTDLMTEFWNRVMSFTNDTLPGLSNAQRLRDKSIGKRSIKLSKQKIKNSRKMKRRGKSFASSTNWDVESDDCPNETETMKKDIESNSNFSHILRVKPTGDFDFRNESTNRVVQKSKGVTRSRNGSKVNVSFNDDDDPIENETQISQRRSSSRIHEKTLLSRETVKKITQSANTLLSVSDDRGFDEPTNNSQFSTTKSASISSEGNNPGDAESAYYSQSSAINESGERVLNYECANIPDYNFRKKSTNNVDAVLSGDEDPSDATPERYYDSETPESTLTVTDQGSTRKRKRAYSPRATKRTVRSKLFGKLRALKKNSIGIVSKGTGHSIVDNGSSRSPSKTRKQSIISESDSTEIATRNEQPIIEIAAKRQRIAHVPKKSLTRDSDQEEMELLETTKLQEDAILIPDSLQTFDSSLTTKTHGPIGISINSREESIPTTPDVSNSSNIENNSPTDHSKSLGYPVEDHDFYKNEEIGKKFTDNGDDKVKKDNKTKIRGFEAARTAASSASSVTSARTKLTRKSLTEIPGSSFLSSKLPASLQELTSANILVPPMRSQIDRKFDKKDPTNDCDDKTESSGQSKRDFLNAPTSSMIVAKERNSHLSEATKETPSTNDFYRDTMNPSISGSLTECSVQTPRDCEINSTSVAERTERPHSACEFTSPFAEKSPASPDDSTILQRSASFSANDLTRPRAKNFDEHSSIYDGALPSASTSPCNHYSSETTITRRSLLNYDTRMDYQENSEEFGSPISSNSKNDRTISDNRFAKFQNIVKDLRTRKITCSDESAASRQENDEQNKSLSTEESIEAAAYQRGIRSLGTLLTRHLGQVKTKTGNKATLRKSAAVKLQIETEKTVRSELVKLVENEEWTSEVHDSVIAKLRHVSSPRTISKSIVDFLIERANIGETLDRTYTPPAPVMTRTQQRIVALINGLERDPSMSGVFELVRAGIEFNLFKPAHGVQFGVVEPLARMVTVMARMKKDRERVRILCCDALYFLGRKASAVIYVVLTIWPEVFPAHDSHPDEIFNCLVHLMRMEQSVKATSVKRMLKEYYNYPESQTNSVVLMKRSINALKEKYSDELEIVILLIAKREGTGWTYKHVVNDGLLKIIDDDNYSSLLNALTLFGFILRVFPMEDEDGAVATSVEKLCKMIDSIEDSPNKEEGIVSALLSLSRHKMQFNKIADSILKWKPNQAMRTTTIEQLNSFFKLRSYEWWNNRKRNKLKSSKFEV